MAEQADTWFRAFLKKAGFLIYPASGLLISVGLVALICDLAWFHFAHEFRNDPLGDTHVILEKVAAWSLGFGSGLGLVALYVLEITKPKRKTPETDHPGEPAAPAAGAPAPPASSAPVGAAGQPGVSPATGAAAGTPATGVTVVTPPPDPDPAYSREMFGRSLVGIGFALLLDAIISVVAVAGFARADAIPYLFPSASHILPPKTNAVPTATTPRAVGDQMPVVSASPGSDATNIPTADFIGPTLRDKKRNLISCIQVLLALGFTLMGALFFFAKSLWDKMRTTSEAFDERIFWAGLWFRMATAVVCTLVIYLALLAGGHDDALGWMPFIALLLGLSVKTAETLVSGITKRVFAAISAMVGKS